MDREKEGTPGLQTGHAPSEGAINARAAPAGSSAHSELRRRLLLRGLVGGPVVLAGMRPVRTLAKAKKYCQYSGWHSFKVDAQTSASPNGKSKCTSGKSPSVVKRKLSKLPKSKKQNGGKQSRTRYPITGAQPSIFIKAPPSGISSAAAAQIRSRNACKAVALTPPSSRRFTTPMSYNSSGGYPLKYTDVYAVWDGNWANLSPGASGLKGLTSSQAALFFEQLDSIG